MGNASSLQAITPESAHSELLHTAADNSAL